MSESPAKVRLVRCPKCENLLPEVTDYAVYQCGGCGAVLRATNKHIESGRASEKSGDESDVVSNKVSKELSNIDFSNRSVKNTTLVSENGLKSNGSSGRKQEENEEFNDSKSQFENIKNSSRRSIWASNGSPGLHEGSSSYHFAPRPEYAVLAQTTHDHDDRAELLRKLDELKDEIVRSRDKSIEKNLTHHNNYNNYPYVNNTHLNRHSLPSSNPVQIFNDPFRSQNLNQPPIMHFDQNLYNPYYPGQYISNDMNNNRLFHHPVMQNDPVFYQRFSNPSLNVHNPEPKPRWSSNDLRRRGILAAGGRRCLPVCGGSPFVSCCKCFELLQIPPKNIKKMRCASCSEVILLSIVNKKIVLSVYTENISVKSKNNREKYRDVNSSEDYDNSGKFDFESLDRLPLGNLGLTSEKSTLSYTSEDVRIADVAMSGNKPEPPPTGSPLQDHFDYSTKYNRAGKGDRSGRSDIVIPVNVGSAGGSVKDDVVASEIEISSNEYCVNTGTSQESGDTSDQRRNNGGHESFFTGMIRNSLRGFSRSSQSQHVDSEKVNVTVNGRPIPDRLVKKAEKLAGTIKPGEYWYDTRAGFWGVMGGPCRGIIPPFIEEFNYPMPEKCADGNTNVFVNGRELHQRDLDLLASRGLPTDNDRSYIIEISGRVLDEDSGQELECLGKLAPTVESKKHGFGMKPPRATPT